MSTSTLKHDRKIRQERKAAKARADREQAHADLITEVKEGAMKLAGEGSTKTIRDLPKEFVDPEFDTLTTERQISILEDYIEQLRELGARLSKEYSDNEGAQEELSKIEDRINAAGEMIVKIELANVKPIV